MTFWFYKNCCNKTCIKQSPTCAVCRLRIGILSCTLSQYTENSHGPCSNKWKANRLFVHSVNSVWIFHLMYFSMNFLWKSDRRVSLMKRRSFLSTSPRAQFLKTTSSSHLNTNTHTPTKHSVNNQTMAASITIHNGVSLSQTNVVKYLFN